MSCIDRLRGRFPGEVLETGESGRQESWARVRSPQILIMLRFLRDDSDLRFEMLVDVTAVDRLHLAGGAERFEVIYTLYSLSRNEWIRVHALLAEEEVEIDSATALWHGANWAEREVYDMFGIRFRGHPDLRRILMPEGYQGHPLRKDYPLKGRGEREAFERVETAR